MSGAGISAAERRVRGERLGNLGLWALVAAVIALACVAFSDNNLEPPQARPPEASLEISPDQILNSLGNSRRVDPERGEQIYRIHCIPCHGEDGNLGLAGARRFGREPFQNTSHGRGAHPVNLFDTLQNGFRKMIPQTHLSVADRLATIHYVREKLVREQNPGEYVALNRPDGKR